ncbi:MAG: hypothetical protein R2827_09025 [Bdellovibrionales bacterium]
MKILTLIFSLLVVAPFASATVCNQKSLEAAKNINVAVQHQFEIGMAPIADAYEAKVFLIEQQYCMGTISKEEFCSAGIEALEDSLGAVEAGHAVGVNSLSDLIEAVEKLAKAETDCQ